MGERLVQYGKSNGTTNIKSHHKATSNEFYGCGQTKMKMLILKSYMLEFITFLKKEIILFPESVSSRV